MAKPSIREYLDCYLVKTVQLPEHMSHAWEERLTLFEPHDFPEDDFVLGAFKVDTNIEYPEFAKLWMRFSFDDGGNSYDFPCSAFDRLVPDYVEEDAGYDDDGNRKEPEPVLKMQAPKLGIPLYKKAGRDLHASVFVNSPQPFEASAGAFLTVTAHGAGKRPITEEVAHARSPEPRPHPTLGWCHFCLNHPTWPRKVPAVTRTENNTGVPRCGPCGRWRE